MFDNSDRAAASSYSSSEVSDHTVQQLRAHQHYKGNQTGSQQRVEPVTSTAGQKQVGRRQSRSNHTADLLARCREEREDEREQHC